MLTGGSTDDAQTGLTLIEAIDSAVSRFTADGAYDTVAIYEAAGARGATVVVPPTKTAAVSRRRRRASARDYTILRVKEVGRRQWKKEAGYHRQARVENAFFRYKVDHWRPASCSTSEGPGNRSSDRVQHPEPDDRAWSTGLVCHRAVKVAGSGRFSLLSGSCTNDGMDSSRRGTPYAACMPDRAGPVAGGVRRDARCVSRVVPDVGCRAASDAAEDTRASPCVTPCHRPRPLGSAGVGLAVLQSANLCG